MCSLCSCDTLLYLILQEELSSESEEKRLLSVKVKLDEGGYGYVFSVRTTDLSVRWRCHLCDVLIIGQKHVVTHIESKKHQVKMALPSHPAYMFTRLDTKPLGESVFCGDASLLQYPWSAYFSEGLSFPGLRKSTRLPLLTHAINLTICLIRPPLWSSG
jgi:hypothetical protein